VSCSFGDGDTGGMGVMTVSVFVGVAVLFGRWWGGVVWERVWGRMGWVSG
jgi:hypothetical protein